MFEKPIEAKWVSIDEFMEMCNKNEIVPTIDFGLEEYNRALDIIYKRKRNNL